MKCSPVCDYRMEYAGQDATEGFVEDGVHSDCKHTAQQSSCFTSALTCFFISWRAQNFHHMLSIFSSDARKILRELVVGVVVSQAEKDSPTKSATSPVEIGSQTKEKCCGGNSQTKCACCSNGEEAKKDEAQSACCSGQNGSESCCNTGTPQDSPAQKLLLILYGSQKGTCKTFAHTIAEKAVANRLPWETKVTVTYDLSFHACLKSKGVRSQQVQTITSITFIFVASSFHI